MLTFKKNNIVQFTGNKHFTLSTANAMSKPALPGTAKVFMVHENDPYPYHVIAEPWDKSDVYGWVAADDIKSITVNTAIEYLTYLQVINNPEYWNNFVNQVQYIDKLFINSCQVISGKKNNNLDFDTALNKLITAKVINIPEYWQEQAAKYSNIFTLIIKLANAIDDTIITNNTTNTTNSEKNKANFIKTAQSYLGYNEWDGSHQTIIDIYNNYGNLPRNYSVSNVDAWCATFVSAMAILCGLADTVIPRECSCEHQINLFKELGSWIEDDNYMPVSGDIAYYTWDGNEYYDSTEWSDHVGIVVNTITEDEILVIEGNKNDQVAYRTIWRNYPYIRGYAHPKY